MDKLPRLRKRKTVRAVGTGRYSLHMSEFQEFTSGKDSFTLFSVTVVLSKILARDRFLFNVGVSPPFLEKNIGTALAENTVRPQYHTQNTLEENYFS
jgi:hypothetical protein